MESVLLAMGRIAGLGSLILTAWAGYARLTGAFFAGGFQVGTLLLVGIMGMLVACFFLLLALTLRRQR